MRRIVYVGCGLGGRGTSLLSVLVRGGIGMPDDPSRVLSGEHRFVFARASGGSIALDLSISRRRAHFGDYDQTSAECDHGIRDEIERIAAADGLIFVIDSRVDRRAANIQQFDALRTDLGVRGVDAAAKPTVFQVNKRDLVDIVTMDWVREHFRAERCAYIESVAVESKGTLEAMREVLRLTGALE